MGHHQGLPTGRSLREERPRRGMQCRLLLRGSEASERQPVSWASTPCGGRSCKRTSFAELSVWTSSSVPERVRARRRQRRTVRRHARAGADLPPEALRPRSREARSGDEGHADRRNGAPAEQIQAHRSGLQTAGGIRRRGISGVRCIRSAGSRTRPRCRNPATTGSFRVSTAPWHSSRPSVSGRSTCSRSTVNVPSSSAEIRIRRWRAAQQERSRRAFNSSTLRRQVVRGRTSRIASRSGIRGRPSGEREGDQGSYEGAVRLGAHLVPLDDVDIPVWDFGRADLDADVAPGGGASIDIALRTPDGRALYQDRVRHGREGVAWFEDRGSSVDPLRSPGRRLTGGLAERGVLTRRTVRSRGRRAATGSSVPTPRRPRAPCRRGTAAR